MLTYMKGNLMSTEIIVAIITSVGVIIAALIGLLPKVLNKQKNGQNNAISKEITGVYDVYYQYVSKERASKEFVYSHLTIKNSGKALFHNNISSQNMHPEYTYSGTWDMDQDIVYINLKNNVSKERVFMALKTSLGKHHRMIGIISALSTISSPVSLKVACFKVLSSPNDVDKEQLSKIFDQPNRNWKSNVLTLEEKEIALFFSDKMQV